MRAHSGRGFTLIELLVAIALMALMAVLGWRGLDGMGRAQGHLAQHADDVQTLQATLAQWGADLDALAEQPQTPSLDWDGRVLRVLRRSSADAGDGLLVVGWTRRALDGQGQWWRWQSPPLRTRADLMLAWQKAQAWGQNPSDDDRLREVRTVPLDGWQIFYHRGNAWSNPLSSAGTTAGPTPVPETDARGLASVVALSAGVPSPVPDGVRLVLTLPAGQAVSGVLTRDWVRGQLGGGQ